MRHRRPRQRRAAIVGDLSDWADRKAMIDGKKQHAVSKRLMAQYDRLPREVRRVEWVTGKIEIAQRLVASGYTTPEVAEPVVRRMLERMA